MAEQTHEVPDGHGGFMIERILEPYNAPSLDELAREFQTIEYETKGASLKYDKYGRPKNLVVNFQTAENREAKRQLRAIYSDFARTREEREGAGQILGYSRPRIALHEVIMNFKTRAVNSYEGAIFVKGREIISTPAKESL
ncbi:MAG: hypothetical protein AABY22_29375 [Nanoarchaeota archaeon]